MPLDSENFSLTSSANDPLQKQDVDSSDRIKIACIAEFGMNGEVNAVKVAHELRLDVEVVTAWLDANYVRLHKPGDVVRYT